MKVLKQSVGFDISKDDFGASILALTEEQEIKNLGNKKFSNTPSGFQSLMKWVSITVDDKIPIHYIMEYTGVYYEALAYFLYRESKTVHVVLAHQAKKFAESLNIKMKTDKGDAKFLAQMGVERQLRVWEPSLPIYKKLKALTREKEDVQKELTIVKNQLHALEHSEEAFHRTKTRVKNRIKYLSSQIKSIDLDIKNAINSDAKLNEVVKNLTTIPGIGISTVACILAETNGFQYILNQKQLTSYAGLDVQIQESGKWVGRSKISKKGNSQIRRALYMPSLSVIQHTQTYSIFYKRLKEKKEKSKIALTAVQRKMLCLIYALWKKGEIYQENYEETIDQFKTSGNDETKASFNFFAKQKQKEERTNVLSSQDRLRFNESTEDFFQLQQK